MAFGRQGLIGALNNERAEGLPAQIATAGERGRDDDGYNSAIFQVLAGRSGRTTREASAITSSDRLMIKASCDTDANWDTVIGSKSVVNRSARPR